MDIKYFKNLLLMLTFAGLFSLNSYAERIIVNIDENWKFSLGNIENSENPRFDDSSWQVLDVPHDWSIEGDYDENNPTRRGGGYLPVGIGWYRKTLELNSSLKGKRLFIEFEGVMANSDVWINGHHLGHRPFGYLPLLYDITEYVDFDGSNIVSVRADNTTQPASRWYTGAGIYRHVKLLAVDPLHIDRWGVFINTPQVGEREADVNISASLTNSDNSVRRAVIRTVIKSPTGKTFQSSAVPVELPAGESIVISQEVKVLDPELWDIDDPNIYTALTTIEIDGEIIDNQINTFGIRTFSFESETGFWLNGRNIKILGACVHHDGGPLGAAVPASVWERRIERLKEIGCNAVRGGHAPMNPEFYDICDRMGMLVMDETFDTWTAAKPNGEKAYNLYFNDWWEVDARAQIVRVRNHPSIVIYSLGNEIRDNLNSEEGLERFLGIRSVTKELDPTRPITMALFRPVQMKLFENGFSELLDVIGQNYGETGLLAAWKAKPGRKIIGTENTPSRSS
ncbi:MAG: hypothetical protein LIO79_05245 [Rikenellaceae bacterium]|nr:hypothetical protein [Rikenellaceae bacterium]